MLAHHLATLLGILFLGAIAPEEKTPAGVTPVANQPAPITPSDWLVLPRAGDYRRAALHTDPVEALLARGDWIAPTAGLTVRSASGAEVAWRNEAEGSPADLSGGYAYARFKSPQKGVMLLEAPGVAAVCLNGDWLPGDPYGEGWFRPPVKVRGGENWMLVHLARPSARARLVATEHPVSLIASQAKIPSLPIGGNEKRIVGSILLQNATQEPLVRAILTVRWKLGEESISKSIEHVDPLLLTPITFEIPPPPAAPDASDPGVLVLEVRSGENKDIIASAELTPKQAGGDAIAVNTFVSDIDQSVQQYAVRESTLADSNGLIVLLHDAGELPEEALDGLAPSAGWSYLAPTGRGKWGFDWEDWSRLDALEALDDYLAKRHQQGQPIDEKRIAILGHGMGGHGALHIATTTPDRFAGVGVLDGWLGLRTSRRKPTRIEALSEPRESREDVLRLTRNLTRMRVAVVATESSTPDSSASRTLRDTLNKFHTDFAYHERAAIGVELIEELASWLLANPAKPTNAHNVELITPDTATLATSNWATILGAERPDSLARIRLERDPETATITGETENVTRLRFDLSDWSELDEQKKIQIKLDGKFPVRFRIGGRNGSTIALSRLDDGTWARRPDVNAGRGRFAGLFKGPQRSGGFKRAFFQRPLLIYGTKGSDEENRWAAAKARYDAMQFLYRGGGHLAITSDQQWLQAARAAGGGVNSSLADRSRSIILYGASQTNDAWFLVDQDAARRGSRTIQLASGVAWLGSRPESGDNLSLLAIRPRVGSDRAYVGVIGGTGISGMRATTRLRYFWSGTMYPDYLLTGLGFLESDPEKSKTEDVRAAGWFDSDWGCDSNGIRWRDLAL